MLCRVCGGSGVEPSSVTTYVRPCCACGGDGQDRPDVPVTWTAAGTRGLHESLDRSLRKSVTIIGKGKSS